MYRLTNKIACQSVIIPTPSLLVAASRMGVYTQNFLENGDCRDATICVKTFS